MFIRVFFLDKLEDFVIKVIFFNCSMYLISINNISLLKLFEPIFRSSNLVRLSYIKHLYSQDVHLVPLESTVCTNVTRIVREVKRVIP